MTLTLTTRWTASITRDGRVRLRTDRRWTLAAAEDDHA